MAIAAPLIPLRNCVALLMQKTKTASRSISPLIQAVRSVKTILPADQKVLQHLHQDHLGRRWSDE